MKLSIVVQPGVDTGVLARKLGKVIEPRFILLDTARAALPDDDLLIDIDLRDPGHVAWAKRLLAARRKGDKVVFAVDKSSRFQKIQAYALGATDLVHRPVEPGPLLAVLEADVNLVGHGALHPDLHAVPAAAQAYGALENIFARACLGQPLALDRIHEAGRTLTDSIEAEGLGHWLALVRRHHSVTYQHSLIVTGVAVAFGQSLGFSAADRHKLAFAGMLHDIGKARVPLSILEKRGPLDDIEMTVMRKHPVHGFDALKGEAAVSKEMLDMVLHHHEYLDGTGYPHGLRGPEISDLVRIITIADVFGALIEQRSYRDALSSAEAYEVLLGMDGKFDAELVKAFAPTARLEITPAPAPARSRLALH